MESETWHFIIKYLHLPQLLSLPLFWHFSFILPLHFPFISYFLIHTVSSLWLFDFYPSHFWISFLLYLHFYHFIFYLPLCYSFFLCVQPSTGRISMSFFTLNSISFLFGWKKKNLTRFHLITLSLFILNYFIHFSKHSLFYYFPKHSHSLFIKWIKYLFGKVTMLSIFCGKHGS